MAVADLPPRTKGTDPRRVRRIVALLLAGMVLAAGGLYAYAEQACPVPSWAFWTEEYEEPRINFGFAKCD